ncbi:hypothetical protein [Streptomyces mirabilis]|uniref:hypothetical protein n=1 Tax=Streptomyces mirabilis TaxID=68239 RepID=UPI00224D0C7A|nr:hypothetical protein [Streptomyces mirabilis]MCX4429420.1 hypothetical protein [Streptomyces mirabilis]
MKKTRRPPKKASFKDAKVRELVTKAPESAPVIGIGTSGRTVSVDLDAESPHILVNASTGGGKSVTLRCITCQMLHHAAQAYVLDYKRISHPWARGIPAVTYCADIHDALIELGWEGRRRVRVADELGIDADPGAIGPRLLILLEEVNATLTSPPAEAGGFFPRGLSFLLLRQQLPRTNGKGRWYAQQSYASSTDLTSRQPGGRPGQLGYRWPDGLQTTSLLRVVGGGRRSALAANRLSLPCSAGVRFLPRLKAGVSTEESR